MDIDTSNEVKWCECSISGAVCSHAMLYIHDVPGKKPSRKMWFAIEIALCVWIVPGALYGRSMNRKGNNPWNDWAACSLQFRYNLHPGWRTQCDSLPRKPVHALMVHFLWEFRVIGTICTKCISAYLWMYTIAELKTNWLLIIWYANTPSVSWYNFVERMHTDAAALEEWRALQQRWT